MAKWPRKVSVVVTSLPYVVQSFAVFLTLKATARSRVLVLASVRNWGGVICPKGERVLVGDFQTITAEPRLVF